MNKIVRLFEIAGKFEDTPKTIAARVCCVTLILSGFAALIAVMVLAIYMPYVGVPILIAAVVLTLLGSYNMAMEGEDDGPEST